MHWFVRRLTVVSAVLALLVAGACGGKEEPLGPTATLGQPTTTTDPYAIPAVIDQAYVNRVLAGLDHAVGEVTRIVVRERAIPQEAVDRLKALFVGEFLSLRVASYEADMRDNFSGYRENPGDRTTVVTRIISSSPSCIFAEVERDYSAGSNRPEAATTTTQWIAIRHTANFVDFNPTKWIFIYDGYRKSRTEPPDPCAGGS